MCVYILFIIQEEAHHRFNPSVFTHHQIKDFSLNASFYTLAEYSREAEEMFVESLLVEVRVSNG